ncbi:hypothetical protein [Hoeflea sp. TYP-13]|uniref:hypothetical protein n=1 Tax=Hoeflea sp. TYP-13 TaxID=3230023 RepID=UPI0034C5D15D
MKRILIIGNGGAGKTTLSKLLGQKLELPLVHLDELLWQPGWIETERQVFDRHLSMELEKEKWIIDGNYVRTLPQRLARADTVIFLDFNRWVCTARVIKRWLLQDGYQAEGCPHKVDWPFFKYVFAGFAADIRKRILVQRDKSGPARWITLKNTRDVEKFLAGASTRDPSQTNL